MELIDHESGKLSNGLSVRGGSVKSNRVIFRVGVNEAEDAIAIGGVGADGGPGSVSWTVALPRNMRHIPAFQIHYDSRKAPLDKARLDQFFAALRGRLRWLVLQEDIPRCGG